MKPLPRRASSVLSILAIAGLALTTSGCGSEDVAPEAFGGLYRRWDGLASTDGTLYYVRISVLNGCRSALRRRAVRRGAAAAAAGPAVGPPLSLTAAGEEKEDWRSGPLTHYVAATTRTRISRTSTPEC